MNATMPAHGAPTEQAPANERGDGSPLRTLRIVTGLALALAVAALAIAVVGIVTRPLSVAPSRVAALEKSITRLSGSVTTDESNVASLQSSSNAGVVNRMRATLSKVTTCLPQLQTEIGGLGINWQLNGLNTSSDSFTITNPTILSNDCSSTLYGG